MPETPKVFRKKSKVKTWFNGLAREVLTGENLPVRESKVATGNTVATFQGYPSLPSDDSGSEVEISYMFVRVYICRSVWVNICMSGCMFKVKHD